MPTEGNSLSSLTITYIDMAKKIFVVVSIYKHLYEELYEDFV